MKKSQNVFLAIEKVMNKLKLNQNVDFIVVDVHGEITSEKMALGHLLDGRGYWRCRYSHSCTNFRL